MKKIVSLLFVSLVLVGCGSTSSTVCTLEDDGVSSNGYTLNREVTYIGEKGALFGVLGNDDMLIEEILVETYKFDTKELFESYTGGASEKEFAKTCPVVEKPGEDGKFACSKYRKKSVKFDEDKLTITIKTTIDMEKIFADGKQKEEFNDKNLTKDDSGYSYSVSVKSLKEQKGSGYKCKEK